MTDELVVWGSNSRNFFCKLSAFGGLGCIFLVIADVSQWGLLWKLGLGLNSGSKKACRVSGIYSLGFGLQGFRAGGDVSLHMRFLKLQAHRIESWAAMKCWTVSRPDILRFSQEPSRPQVPYPGQATNATITMQACMKHKPTPLKETVGHS